MSGPEYMKDGDAGTFGTGYNPNTGAPLTPSGDPYTIPDQSNKFDPLSTPYAAPTYALTPQSGYTGLAQQLQTAFGLSPQAMTTPRNSLLPMYASPWSQLYGGPASPTFAEVWGQDPGMGTATPPGVPGAPGTISYVPPAPPTTPAPTTPPPTTPPAPPPPGTPPPPNSVPGGSPSGGVPTTPTPRNPTYPTQPGGGGSAGTVAKMLNGMMLPPGYNFEQNLPITGPEGMDLGRILFPNGRPNGPWSHTGPRKGILPGGFTGPGGADMGSLLFPNGRPTGGRRT